jgi:hypothetical protein
MKTGLILFALLSYSMICMAQVHLGPGQTFANIQAAHNAGAIHPGDTVFLHAGSYAGYQWVVNLSGTSNAWITITRYKQDAIDISGGWQFVSCRYLRFQNLNFKGNTAQPGRLFSVDNGGSCATQSKFIVVDNCSFSNTTDAAAITAFKFGGVDSFEVKNCVFKDIPACEAMDYNVCHAGLISKNRFENCLSGGHIKGGASDITMERNLFLNASNPSWVAFELGGDTGAQFYCPEDHFEVKNLRFYSNIIVGGYRGVALSSAVNCKVINNTFYNCGQATMRFLTTSVLYPTLSGNVVENNLFAFGASAYMNGSTQPAGAANFANNIYYSITNPSFNGPYWDTPALDAIKDPNPLIFNANTTMFVDAPNNDFHLVSGSPAIGTGKAQNVPLTDFYGNPFSPTAPSIGAVAFETTAPPSNITPPTLPNTTTIETCLPDTSGYVVITVGPVGRDFSNLQAAIDAAEPGTILKLDAGAEFKGSFTLPNKSGNGWIIFMSSEPQLLPAQGARVNPNAATGNTQFPLQKDAMPKIITTNLSGLPCFKTQAAAHHYRFVGLEITADPAVLNSYGLMFLGDASSAQNTLNSAPHDLIVDRCYIHGHSNATIMKGGVLLNCANAAVLDSYIADFHSVGYDTYAIAGTNGTGPFKILNNYLEAAGENILFGGAAPAIPGLVPSDIEVRNNYFFKPFSWRVGHPEYAGKHWTVKNLFELKTGKRVLLDGNILENCWADLPTGQSGYAILLTVRAENGAAPQADVSDITITNNIIRHAGAGISLSGHDNPTPSLQSKRIRIANNLFDDISGPSYGDGNVAGPNDGTFLKIGDPSDVIIDHNTVFQSGPITWTYDTVQNITFTNNIFNCFVSAGGYQGMYGPGFAQGGNGPMGAFFPGIKDANQLFHKNVLIGGNAAKYSNYNTLSQNYFPANATAVQFTNYTNGSADYHGYALANASVYRQAGTDGLDLGAVLNILDTALNINILCENTTSVFSPVFHLNTVRIQPNPFHAHTTLVCSKELKNATLFISNLLGQEVRRIAHLNGETIELELPDLQVGVYVFRIVQGDRMIANGRLISHE